MSLVGACTACGIEAKLERAHIVPEALGGGETIVLCHVCHLLAPDCVDPDVMLAWIDSIEPAANRDQRVIRQAALDFDADLTDPNLLERIFNFYEFLGSDCAIPHGGKFSQVTREWMMRTAIRLACQPVRTDEPMPEPVPLPGPLTSRTQGYSYEGTRQHGRRTAAARGSVSLKMEYL